jgi:predicted aspartyl protease
MTMVGVGQPRSRSVTWHRRSPALLCLLLLALVGCAQSSGCDLVKVAEVPLEPRSRLLTIPATINGHAIIMVLDTGGQKSMLFEAAVTRLGIVRDARFNTPLIGIAGGSAHSDASIDSMSIGGEPISVNRLSVNTFGSGTTIDGLLGLDILRDYDLDIDPPKHTLTLYRVRRCEQADPPWDEPATRIDETSTLMNWLKMPFEIDGIEGTVVVDTGNTTTMITPRMMRRLGLTEEAMANDRVLKIHVPAAEDAQARVHRFQTIRIGPMTVQNASILVLPKEPPALGDARSFGDGFIGLDFLASRRTWFSIRTGRLYFATNAAASGH